MNVTACRQQTSPQFDASHIKGFVVVDRVKRRQKLERPYAKIARHRGHFRIVEADKQTAILFVDFQNFARPESRLLDGFRIGEFASIDQSCFGAWSKGDGAFPSPIEIDGSFDVDHMHDATFAFGNDANFFTAQLFPLRAIAILLANGSGCLLDAFKVSFGKPQGFVKTGDVKRSRLGIRLSRGLTHGFVFSSRLVQITMPKAWHRPLACELHVHKPEAYATCDQSRYFRVPTTTVRHGAG